MTRDDRFWSVAAALPPRQGKRGKPARRSAYEVLRARFPEDGAPRTFAEVGQALGVSRQRAHALVALALERVEAALAEEAGA